MCEVDDEVPVATCPQLSLVEEISPSEEHHVSRAKADLQLELRKFKVSTLKVSEIKDACPGPVWVRSITVGERIPIEYYLPSFVEKAAMTFSREDDGQFAAQ